METEYNHIHILIQCCPTISASAIARKLKQESTFNIWKNHKSLLYKHFWKENTFWTDGYFVSTIGNVSKEKIMQYIENQG
jgi:putative transposase